MTQQTYILAWMGNIPCSTVYQQAAVQEHAQVLWSQDRYNCYLFALYGGITYVPAGTRLASPHLLVPCFLRTEPPEPPRGPDTRPIINSAHARKPLGASLVGCHVDIPIRGHHRHS
jgi:hypothetical protein